MSAAPRKDTLRIAEEAAEWMDTLETGDAGSNAQFVEWLRASPRHVEEFLLLTASGQMLENTGISADTIDESHPGNVVTLGADHASALPAPRARRRWIPALAAGAAAAALALWQWTGLFSGWQSYATAVGEQRTLELSDGSLLHLNTRTRVAVRMSGDRRDVRLLEGEALFKVSGDSARPFQVDVGDAMVRVLGTQFNVDRRADATQVAVLDGRIEIRRPDRTGTSAAPQFSAGEGARIAGANITRGTVNPAEVIAWRQRRLIFRGSTLAEIAEEFNRYNSALQLNIADEAVKGRRYGGTFDADEPEMLLKFLAGDEHLSLERTRDRVTLRGR